MNGVGASITGALSPRHGVTVDLSYTRASNVFGTGRHSDVLSYLGGPVFYPTRRRELVTYVHGLLGGAKVSGVIPLNTGGFATGYVHHVAWAFGGGIEHWFSDSMAVRVNADAIHTSFYDSSLAIRGQYDLRTMWSVTYHFGRQKRGKTLKCVPRKGTLSASKNPPGQTAPAEEVAAAHIESAVPRF